MSEQIISLIRPDDDRAMVQMDDLLRRQNIRRDKNLEYSLGIYDQQYRLIATGSCFGSTLRCLAVDPQYMGQGLMEQLVTYLMEYQIGRGIRNVYVYTKYESAKYFRNLGFYDIVSVGQSMTFLEHRKDGFARYLDRLRQNSGATAPSAAIIMNANPFTLGHQYLVEQACKQFPLVHLFLLSDDRSLVPYSVRLHLVKEGCEHLDNVVLHSSEDYLISSATFPSYFLKDDSAAIYHHAQLDVAIFLKIAEALNIVCRYVGDEPFSTVTNQYNLIMKEELPKCGVALRICPRYSLNGQPISASQVRAAIHRGQLTQVKDWLPESSYRYLVSEAGRSVIQTIQAAENVWHY